MNNKGSMTVGGIIIIVVILITLGGFISLYNGLKEAEIRVDASYGQVENQMQRRSDLIPNLVNTVKGYDVHEKSIIEEVVNARAKLAGAQGVEQMDAANAELTGALGRLFAIAEAYPDLSRRTRSTLNSCASCRALRTASLLHAATTMRRCVSTTCASRPSPVCSSQDSWA